MGSVVLEAQLFFSKSLRLYVSLRHRYRNGQPHEIEWLLAGSSSGKMLWLLARGVKDSYQGVILDLEIHPG